MITKSSQLCVEYLESAKNSLLLNYYIAFGPNLISHMNSDPVATFEASVLITKYYSKFGS